MPKIKVEDLKQISSRINEQFSNFIKYGFVIRQHQQRIELFQIDNFDFSVFITIQW